jgi:hypothetical protein
MSYEMPIRILHSTVQQIIVMAEEREEQIEYDELGEGKMSIDIL